MGAMRVWSIEEGTAIAEYPSPLPEPTTAPGLLLLANESQNSLRAFIAWNDGRLRVWDVNRKQVQEVAMANTTRPSGYRIRPTKSSPPRWA